MIAAFFMIGVKDLVAARKLAVVLPVALATGLAAPVAAAPRHPDVDGLSVYRVRPVADGLVLSLATGAALFANQVARESDDVHCPCDRRDVNRFDRGVVGNASTLAGRASDITLLLAVALPPAIDVGLIGWKSVLLEDLVVFAEALAVNGALTSATKVLVRRPRPAAYVGTTDGRSPDLYASFYSGHTSWTFTALSAAVYTSHARYGVLAVPAIAGGLVGASVAFERVAAGKHFYSDVLVGALAGATVGVVVPWLHRRGTGPAWIVRPMQGRGLTVEALASF
jgi:membrane-associated phospholipid phosphatase